MHRPREPRDTVVELPLNGVTISAFTSAVHQLERDLRDGDDSYDRNFVPEDVFEGLDELKELAQEQDAGRLDSIKIVVERSE